MIPSFLKKQKNKKLIVIPHRRLIKRFLLAGLNDIEISLYCVKMEFGGLPNANLREIEEALIPSEKEMMEHNRNAREKNRKIFFDFDALNEKASSIMWEALIRGWGKNKKRRVSVERDNFMNIMNSLQLRQFLEIALMHEIPVKNIYALASEFNKRYKGSKRLTKKSVVDFYRFCWDVSPRSQAKEGFSLFDVVEYINYDLGNSYYDTHRRLRDATIEEIAMYFGISSEDMMSAQVDRIIGSLAVNIARDVGGRGKDVSKKYVSLFQNLYRAKIDEKIDTNEKEKDRVVFSGIMKRIRMAEDEYKTMGDIVKERNSTDSDYKTLDDIEGDSLDSDE